MSHRPAWARTALPVIQPHNAVHLFSVREREEYQSICQSLNGAPVSEMKVRTRQIILTTPTGEGSLPLMYLGFDHDAAGAHAMAQAIADRQGQEVYVLKFCLSAEETSRTPAPVERAAIRTEVNVGHA